MVHRTLTLRRVRLTDDTTTDVEVDEERARSSAVGQDLDPSGPGRAIDLDGYLLLPAPAEPHAHLDKALLAERIPNPTGDLLGAIVAMDANRTSLTVDDIADRAERAARMLVANGITAIRIHVDTMTRHGLRSVEGLVEARRRLAGLVDLQIVALVSWPVTGTDGRRAPAPSCEAALARRRRRRGRLPAPRPRPRRRPRGAARDRRATAAAWSTSTPTRRSTRASSACATSPPAWSSPGFPHRRHAPATACSLGMQPLDVQREVAAEVAAAGVGVVTLPQTNLFLQARDVPRRAAPRPHRPPAPARRRRHRGRPGPTTSRTRSTWSAGPTRWRPPPCW